MISGISGVSHMTGVLAVQPYRGAKQNTEYAAPASKSGMQPAQKAGAVYPGRGASPGTPVEPVSPVKAVTSQGTRGIAYAIPFLRKGMDPAELSVRMRMQYIDPETGQKAAGVTAGETGQRVPGAEGSQSAAGETGQRVPGAEGSQGTAGVQEASGQKECQTCEERKYQDGSDDAGVSYQTPTHIAPEQAASAVRGHEMEHVVRERASAEREDRRVVSQSVSMHTAICPECGRVYVSGGTTRTTTASDPKPDQPAADENSRGGFDVAA